jgi:hypothetical protein
MSWSWWGAPGVLVIGLAWTLAVVALRAGPGRRLNRLLAWLLFLEGAYTGTNVGLILFVEAESAAKIVSYVGLFTQVALPLQYLLFLGEALRTPLTRPFRSRRATVIIAVGTILLTAFAFLRPALFQTEVAPSDLGHWNYGYQGFGAWVVQLYGLTALFGLIAAIHAFRRSSRGSIARNQAGWFIVAFGLRDAYMGPIAGLYPVLRPIPVWGDFLYNPGIGLIWAVYIPLLAYAILKYQLFSIDLRLRFVLRQGSAGVLIATVFLVMSEALESVVAVDGLVAGVLLAMLVAVFLRPAQTLAERMVVKLMPNVNPNDAYLEERRFEIFRAALESAAIDGKISPDEREMLDRLQAELGLDAGLAKRLEREALSQQGIVGF